jgi:hypothetical protein
MGLINVVNCSAAWLDLDTWFAIFGSHRGGGHVTFCHRQVVNGRNQQGWFGNQCVGKPYRVTRFGNGRDRLESPSLGSTPGHPITTCHPELVEGRHGLDRNGTERPCRGDVAFL